MTPQQRRRKLILILRILDCLTYLPVGKADLFKGGSMDERGEAGDGEEGETWRGQDIKGGQEGVEEAEAAGDVLRTGLGEVGEGSL